MGLQADAAEHRAIFGAVSVQNEAPQGPTVIFQVYRRNPIRRNNFPQHDGYSVVLCAVLLQILHQPAIQNGALHASNECM